jgi:hypothetical protein
MVPGGALYQMVPGGALYQMVPGGAPYQMVPGGFDTAIEYDRMAMTATEKTRTAKPAVQATCFPLPAPSRAGSPRWQPK